MATVILVYVFLINVSWSDIQAWFMEHSQNLIVTSNNQFSSCITSGVLCGAQHSIIQTVYIQTV